MRNASKPTEIVLNLNISKQQIIAASVAGHLTADAEIDVRAFGFLIGEHYLQVMARQQHNGWRVALKVWRGKNEGPFPGDRVKC